jgi:hypothetical protein
MEPTRRASRRGRPSVFSAVSVYGTVTGEKEKRDRIHRSGSTARDQLYPGDSLSGVLELQRMFSALPYISPASKFLFNRSAIGASTYYLKPVHNIIIYHCERSEVIL